MDVKFNSHLVFIYYNRTEIARHQILPKHPANGMRTEESHLPFPLWKYLSVDALRDKARETGPKTFEVIRRMFDEAKVEEQPMQTVKAILSIADIYSPEILEKACDKALRQPFPAIKILVSPSAPPITDTLPAPLPISTSPIPK